MRVRKSRVLATCAALVHVAVLGCSGEDQASGVGASKLPEGVHSEAVEHEACSESGHRVEVLDANGDGKPDIKRVYDNGTGKEICRITDLNHDGKPDLYEYYDPNGTIRRREADYDNNGVIDSIEYFVGGKMVRREYDTTGQNRIDTWDFFDSTGKRVRRERDTNNDGKVDQWWIWEGDKVTISTDKNGDGRPDPETTIVLGGGAEGGIGAPIVPDSGAPPPGPPPPPTLDSKPVVPEAANLNAPLDGGAPAGDAGAAPKGKGR